MVVCNQLRRAACRPEVTSTAFLLSLESRRAAPQLQVPLVASPRNQPFSTSNDRSPSTAEVRPIERRWTSLTLHGEMSEWLKEHAWKATPARLGSRSRKSRPASRISLSGRRPEAVKRRRRVWRSSAGVNWSSASAASSCSWCVAIACHEERLHLLVLENLYRRSRGALALREGEKRLLRLRDHGARQLVLVNRVLCTSRCKMCPPTLPVAPSKIAATRPCPLRCRRHESWAT